VRALRSVIDTSDGVIMISPEYNHGMSGVLKNALDWASRPYGRSALAGKPVLTMTASPAFTGGVRAQQQMNETLLAIPARLALRPQIAIGSGEPDGTARVYVVPIDGGTPRRITANGPAYFHGWSPDGKTITFTRLRGENFDTYAVPVAGGPETLIGANDDSAEFSPDGQWISFQSDSTGHMQIWRMHPDGSAKEQLLVSDTSDWFPHISPDGTLIAFLSYAPGTQGHPADQEVEIRVLSLADKKVRTVAKLLGGRGTMNVPSWSPDSKMLAFTSYVYLPE